MYVVGSHATKQRLLHRYFLAKSISLSSLASAEMVEWIHESLSKQLQQNVF
jgi:hypothetical protein